MEARLADIEDLAFVSQDGYLPEAVVGRKIEDGEVFIVEESGTPIGYLRLEYFWSEVPYIALIRVLEPYRGLGASRVLLSHLEAFLRGSAHRVLYSSSQADEPEPQAWHRHMGFEECGVISGMNEGGVGEVFFRKAL